MEYNTEQEIIEGNKILAEFEYDTDDWEYLNYTYSLHKDDLSYNSDYNDLMRVWFKFNSVEISKLDLCYRDKLMGFKGGYIVCLTHKSINEAFNKLLKGILYYNSVKHLTKQ